MPLVRIVRRVHKHQIKIALQMMESVSIRHCNINNNNSTLVFHRKSHRKPTGRHQPLQQQFQLIYSSNSYSNSNSSSNINSSNAKNSRRILAAAPLPSKHHLVMIAVFQLRKIGDFCLSDLCVYVGVLVECVVCDSPKNNKNKNEPNICIKSAAVHHPCNNLFAKECEHRGEEYAFVSRYTIILRSCRVINQTATNHDKTCNRNYVLFPQPTLVSCIPFDVVFRVCEPFTLTLIDVFC